MTWQHLLFSRFTYLLNPTLTFSRYNDVLSQAYEVR